MVLRNLLLLTEQHVPSTYDAQPCAAADSHQRALPASTCGLSGHELIEFGERRTAPSIPSFDRTSLCGYVHLTIFDTLRVSQLFRGVAQFAAR